MDFDAVQVDDLKLAVGEACTNAVKYGCPRCEPHNVGIKCTVVDDGLLVEITNAVAECKIPAAPSEPDLSREGGLGLYLIRKLVDEVDISWECEIATVKMLKRLNPVGVG
jgi:serine/threonine-protein kinase RsbW